jgi:hypothetical protein
MGLHFAAPNPEAIGMYRVRSQHPAFGTLWLGRHSPVVKKTNALKFATFDSAMARIRFWQALLAKGEQLDTKFFHNLEVVED